MEPMQEKTLQRLMPCKYSNNGCTELALDCHESFCEFRQIKCKVGENSECVWVGEAKQLENHVRTKHPHKLFTFSLNLEEDMFYYNLPIANLQGNDCYLHLVDTELFLMIISEKNEEQYYSIRYIPIQKPTYTYYFNMTFKQGSSIVYKFPVEAKPLSGDKSQDSCDCASFPVSDLNLFGDHMEVSIQVKTDLICDTEGFWGSAGPPTILHDDYITTDNPLPINGLPPSVLQTLQVSTGSFSKIHQNQHQIIPSAPLKPDKDKNTTTCDHQLFFETPSTSCRSSTSYRQINLVSASASNSFSESLGNNQSTKNATSLAENSPDTLISCTLASNSQAPQSPTSLAENVPNAQITASLTESGQRTQTSTSLVNNCHGAPTFTSLVGNDQDTQISSPLPDNIRIPQIHISPPDSGENTQTSTSLEENSQSTLTSTYFAHNSQSIQDYAYLENNGQDNPTSTSFE